MSEFEHRAIREMQFAMVTPCADCKSTGRKDRRACSVCKGKGSRVQQVPFERIAEAVKRHQ